MNIIRFEYQNKKRNWKLNALEFDKLNLLVGASGTGKTQIIRALSYMKDITKGDSINGAKWNIEFSCINGAIYIWEGEFDISAYDDLYPKRFQFLKKMREDDDSEKTAPSIIYERLRLNGEIIIDRTSDKILFLGQPTVKLSQKKSILSLLQEEEKIAPILKSFNKILFTDHTESCKFEVLAVTIDFYKKSLASLIDLKNLDVDIPRKLYLASLIFPDTYQRIKSRFTEIFPQIENIKFEKFQVKIKDSVITYSHLHIKEHGVDQWIHEDDISSGMLRTLMQISELYLCSEGTVFLIDEFENSLGVNCIGALTEDIIHSGNQLQFIVTSHHPYIINNIPQKYWKLVTRKGGIVTVHDASQFNLGNSKHDAFMQLLQLDEFNTGTSE